MKRELKYMIFLIGTGLSVSWVLLAYAHANFATKDILNVIFNEITEIKVDIKEINRYLRDKNEISK